MDEAERYAIFKSAQVEALMASLRIPVKMMEPRRAVIAEEDHSIRDGDAVYWAAARQRNTTALQLEQQPATNPQSEESSVEFFQRVMGG